jgi:hypothetical protein
MSVRLNRIGEVKLGQYAQCPTVASEEGSSLLEHSCNFGLQLRVEGVCHLEAAQAASQAKFESDITKSSTRVRGHQTHTI